MSNENSNLRVGSAGAGLFVGSTEIFGGGTKIYMDENVFIRENSDKVIIVIINRTNQTVFLDFNKSYSIPPGSIYINTDSVGDALRCSNSNNIYTINSNCIYLDESTVYSEKMTNYELSIDNELNFGYPMYSLLIEVVNVETY